MVTSLAQVDAHLLVIGAGVGIAIAAPVGPVSLLCVRAAILRGFGAAVATGFGAATADAVAGSVAAFGLRSLVMPSFGWQRWCRLATALALVILGAHAWWTSNRSRSVPRVNV